MMRNKRSPSKLTTTQPEMETSNCKECDLALNRKGEKRPGIPCKECKTEHCFKCAGLSAEICEMMRTEGKSLWTCGDCEKKTVAMKTVLDKIENLHTEIVVIKKGQEGQQAEQERVLEGIKIVETVVKRMEDIEKTQADHGARLLEQETSTRKNGEKIDETEKRTSAIERRLEQIDSDAVSVKMTNAVIRELHNVEKAERNFLISNVQESSSTDAQERKKEDESKVAEIFKQLKTEQIKPVNVIRVGFTGRYARKVLVILRSVEDCEKILRSAENTTLPNEIWISRDRTWSQREEARMNRDEAEKEEVEGAVPKRGRPRGTGRGTGPARPKKPTSGSVRGRGSRQEREESRKRQHSGEEDESKWRRTGEGGRGRSTHTTQRARGFGRGGRRGGGGITATEFEASPNLQLPKPGSIPNIPNIPNVQGTPETATASQLQRSADRPGTPLTTLSGSSSELGAAGGSDETNF